MKGVIASVLNTTNVVAIDAGIVIVDGTMTATPHDCFMDFIGCQTNGTTIRYSPS